MCAINNIEHALRHTSNGDRILAGRNTLQHCSLDIQQVDLLQYPDQYPNPARRLGITDEQMLDMLKGVVRESADENHFACWSIDHSLFLGDLQLVSNSEEITACCAIS